MPEVERTPTRPSSPQVRHSTCRIAIRIYVFLRTVSVLALDTILIVDDSKVLLALVRTILAPHAKRVVTVDSLEGARIAIEQLEDLSLLLCDVILPGGSGFDLVEEIAYAGRTSLRSS